MASDAKTLIALGNCYASFGASEQQLLVMKLGLLRQLVLNQNPMADTSPQTLLKQASCYNSYGASPYMLLLMELALLGQIVANGAGVQHGTGTPMSNGLPANPGSAYIQDDTVSLWVVANGVWYEIVA
jgi:hypothetical protein